LKDLKDMDNEVVRQLEVWKRDKKKFTFNNKDFDHEAVPYFTYLLEELENTCKEKRKGLHFLDYDTGNIAMTLDIEECIALKGRIKEYLETQIN
jgi:CRISPR/Cas system-associated protein Csx1